MKKHVELIILIILSDKRENEMRKVSFLIREMIISFVLFMLFYQVYYYIIKKIIAYDGCTRNHFFIFQRIT